MRAGRQSARTPFQTTARSSRPRANVLAGLLILVASFAPATAQSDVFASVEDLVLPVGPGAQEPSLFATNDGRVLMSWTEPAKKGFAVKMAIRDGAGWTNSRTVVQSDKLFVNWADFPSVVAMPNGTLAMHWLMENGPSTYYYDVNVALSADVGQTWSDVIVPHRDGTKSQHGFVTLLPVAQDRLLAIWLDGRAYDINATGAAETAFTNAAQLRVTTIDSDGSRSQDMALDVRTCTCCQTSAAVTDDGIVLLVYRDRTAGEIRDISIVRRVDGVWSDPATVRADGWEISGCPVNGPAIDTQGEQAIVAWFSAADDIPVVNVAFSNDAGAVFEAAVRIDLGEPAGRVDALMLGDGSALVSWLEWSDAGTDLLICRVRPKSGCSQRQTITLGDASEAINFPKMVLSGNSVYIAWTQPVYGQSSSFIRDTTIRMVRATF